MTSKFGKHLRMTYGNTGQPFRPYQVSSAVYTVIWRSNQQPQIAEPKLYNWTNSSYRMQVTPN